MSLALIPRNRTRYRAWPGLASTRDADRLFEGFLGGRPAPSLFADARPQGFVPNVDVREAEDAYTVTAELPGLKAEDFEVVFEDDVLTLKGEKRSEHEEENEGAKRTESRYGSFERRIRFRAPIDEDEVKARYADGVLTVTIPKPEEAKPTVRTVPVETS